MALSVFAALFNTVWLQSRKNMKFALFLNYYGTYWKLEIPPFSFWSKVWQWTFLLTFTDMAKVGAEERWALSPQHLPARGLLILQILESKGYIWLCLPFFFVKVAALSKWRLNQGTFRADLGTDTWSTGRTMKKRNAASGQALKQSRKLFLGKCFEY